MAEVRRRRVAVDRGRLGRRTITCRHGRSRRAARKSSPLPIPRSDARAAKSNAFGIPRSYASAEAMLDGGNARHRRHLRAARVHMRRSSGWRRRRASTMLCQKPLAPGFRRGRRRLSPGCRSADPADGARELAVPRLLSAHEGMARRRHRRRYPAGPARLSVERHDRRTRRRSGRLWCASPFFRRQQRLLVMEVLIHHLDTLRFLLGEMEVVAARLERSNDDIVARGCRAPSFCAAWTTGCSCTVNAQSRGTRRAAGAARPAAHLRHAGNAGPRRQAVCRRQATCSAWRSSIRMRPIRAPTTRRSRISSMGWTAAWPFETAPADNLKTLALVEDIYRAEPVRPRTQTAIGWPVASGAI